MIFGKSAKLLPALLLSIIVCLTGCTPAKKVIPQNDTRIKPYSINNPGTTNQEKNRINSKLSAAVGRIENVSKATVVILGTSAYAGLDLNPTLNKAQVSAVKAKAASTIKLAEPRIRSIWVTTDKNAISNLERVRSKIRNNKPSSEYSRDLRIVLDHSELVKPVK